MKKFISVLIAIISIFTMSVIPVQAQTSPIAVYTSLYAKNSKGKNVAERHCKSYGPTSERIYYSYSADDGDVADIGFTVPYYMYKGKKIHLKSNEYRITGAKKIKSAGTYNLSITLTSSAAKKYSFNGANTNLKSVSQKVKYFPCSIKKASKSVTVDKKGNTIVKVNIPTMPRKATHVHIFIGNRCDVYANVHKNKAGIYNFNLGKLSSKERKKIVVTLYGAAKVKGIWYCSDILNI